MLVSGVQQSGSAKYICVCVYIYIYTHTHSYSFSVYILSLFFPIMTYYSILNTVPCAKHRTFLLIYNMLYVVVYIAVPKLLIYPSLTLFPL